jgi:hypothetical protein
MRFMYCRNLLGAVTGSHTGCMRLPQSIIQSFSVPAIHFPTIGLAILLFGIASVSAGAATRQLTCNPTGLQFGDIITGQSETLMATVTNTGQTSVTISEVTISNREFTAPQLSLPLSLAAGQSVGVSVSFTPSANGWTQGTIKFSSDASNSTLTLDAEGAGVSSESVTATPSSASFGQVAVGSSATVPVVLTNDRSWKVTLLAVTTTGSGFSMSGPNLPLTLAAGQSATFNVTFNPQSSGTVGGSLLVVSPALTVPLSGTGTTTGQLTIAPAPLSFGNVPVGTTQTEPMTMSAVGATVTVSSASSSSSQFVLNGASFPLTIATGQSMSFNVAFTPQSSGTVSGALTFGSNASNSQAVESLNGTGTVTAYSVNLFWNSSADAVGYNVYRSASTNGTYAKINPILESNTAYTDSTVVSGQTYYYAATSVNSSGQESTRSTPVQAVVP